MEVHAHAHTARKKWSHYFWEFLMLFLAVFCGFLAENQREHYIEHLREKEFVKTLLLDLENDTLNFNRSIQIFHANVDRFDSLRSSIKMPMTTENILNTYKAVTIIQSFSSFNYSDRTIEQLRSAGNFRLIRKTTVSGALIEYDRYIRNTYLTIEKILTEHGMKLDQLQNGIFDYDIYNFLVKKNWQDRQLVTVDSLLSLPVLMTNDKEKLLSFYNSMGMWRNWCDRMVYHSGFAKDKATQLMSLVKKEYHLSERSARTPLETPLEE